MNSSQRPDMHLAVSLLYRFPVTLLVAGIQAWMATKLWDRSIESAGQTNCVILFALLPLTFVIELSKFGGRLRSPMALGIAGIAYVWLTQLPSNTTLLPISIAGWWMLALTPLTLMEQDSVVGRTGYMAALAGAAGAASGMLFLALGYAVVLSADTLFGFTASAYDSLDGVKTALNVLGLHCLPPIVTLVIFQRELSYRGELVFTALEYPMRLLIIPSLIIYQSVLWVYGIQIVVTHSLPRGGLATMVMLYGVAGYAAVLVTSNQKMIRPAGVVRLFRSSFFVGLAPLIILAGIGLYVRITTYGVTENRIFVGALLAWLFGLSAYGAVRKGHRIAPLLLPLGAIFLGLSYGPFNALKLSLAAQARVAESILAEVKRSMAHGEQPRLSTLTLWRLSAAFEHLCTHKAFDEIKRLSPSSGTPTEAQAGSAFVEYQCSRALIHSWRLGYVSSYTPVEDLATTRPEDLERLDTQWSLTFGSQPYYWERNVFVLAALPTELVLGLGDWPFQHQTWESMTSDLRDGVMPSVELSGTNGDLLLKMKDESIRLPLLPTLQRLWEEHLLTQPLRRDLGTIQFQGATFSGSLVLSNASGSQIGGRITVESLSGVLLIHFKEDSTQREGLR